MQPGVVRPERCMTKSELVTHLQAIGVRPAGVEYIIESALSPPNIQLRSGPKNNIVGDVSTTLPTYLDDCVQEKVVPRLQFASLSAEHAYFVYLESRGDVLLALNHPRTEVFSITNALSRSQRIEYTADDCVVTQTQAWVIEIKTDDGARELAKKRPTDWQRTAEGYEYLPAKAHFAEMGLEHRVVVSSALPWIRTRNLQMLARLPELDSKSRSDANWNDIVKFVRANWPSSLEQIVRACRLENAVPILRLIKESKIHVDLDQATLASPDSRIVCDTLPRARNVARGISSVQALAKSGATVAFDRIGDPRHLDEIGYRIAFLAGEAKERDETRKLPSLRTQQRWKKAERENGKLALAPKWFRCGRRKPKTARWHRKLLIRHLRKARRTTTGTSRTEAHTNYETAFFKAARRRKSSEKAITYGYFCALWRRRDHDVVDAASRGGRRLANKVAPHKDVDSQIAIATGPFQVAHVDHCLIPTHCKDAPHNEGEGDQPWLTLLVDAWNDEPLAMYISFKHPSGNSDLAILRDCVRRHGRLPHAILSDHGPDFKGNVFIQALAVLKVDSFLRGEANPRTGQSVERTFGTMASTICRGHVGFALDIPNARAISSKKHPSKGKKRDFQEVVDDCELLFFTTIPNLPRLDGGPTKLQKRANFEAIYGKQGVKHQLDLAFQIATAPPLKVSGSIEPAGALRIGPTRYYATVLVEFASKKKPILRAEPDDDTVIYLSYRGKWHVAKSRDALENMGRSDAVIRADVETRKRPTKASKNARRRALHAKRPRDKAVPRERSSARDRSSPCATKKAVRAKKVVREQIPNLENLPPAFARRPLGRKS